MSAYTLSDFSETLERVKLPSLPAFALRAWGESGDYAEWSGGFVLRLQDGSYAYISGWCDTTGWGCRDGAEVSFAPTLDALDMSGDHQQPTSADSWDEEPADLNNWIAAGMPSETDTWNDIGRNP